MFTARVKDTGEFLNADAYEEFVQEHGDDSELCCGNPDCNGSVHYREGSAEMGNAHGRAAHFAAHDILDHPSCGWVSEPEEETKRTMSLVSALAAGRSIVLNLNFSLGLSSLQGTFKKHAGVWESNTPYTKALNAMKGHYQALSVKSVSELLAVVSQARNLFGDDVTDRFYVGNNLEILSYNDFDLTQDRSKLKALWHALVYDEKQKVRINDQTIEFGEVAERTRNGTVKSIPRLFRFKPTQKSLTQHYGSVKGSPVLIDELPFTKFLLLLDIEPSSKEQRKALQAQDGGVYVLASAQLNGGENYAQMRKYKDGGYDVAGHNGQKDNVFTSLRLLVENDRQTTPIADVQKNVQAQSPKSDPRP